MLTQLLEVSFEETPPQDWPEASKNLYIDSVSRLREIHSLLLNCYLTIQQSKVPGILQSKLVNIAKEFLQFHTTLIDLKVTKLGANQGKIFNDIKLWYNKFVIVEGTLDSRLVTTNTVMSYKQVNTAEVNFQLLQDELKSKIALADQMIGQLQDPTALELLGKYSTYYKDAAQTNRGIASKWLNRGMWVSSVFIALVVAMLFANWPSNKLELNYNSLGLTGFKEIINYPVILTKLLFSSIVIYIIVFCFRQYGIYRGMAESYFQKQMAFDSYKLFDTASGVEDKEAKKALLDSLARTIYETTNFGFTSSSNERPSVTNVFANRFPEGE